MFLSRRRIWSLFCLTFCTLLPPLRPGLLYLCFSSCVSNLRMLVQHRQQRKTRFHSPRRTLMSPSQHFRNNHPHRTAVCKVMVVEPKGINHTMASSGEDLRLVLRSRQLGIFKLVMFVSTWFVLRRTEFYRTPGRIWMGSWKLRLRFNRERR